MNVKRMIRRLDRMFNRSHPKGFENLEYAFTLDGRRYYRWASDTQMPLSRLKQLEVFLMHKFTGLLQGELNQFAVAIEQNQIKAIENRNNEQAFVQYMGNISALTHELKHRDNQTIRDQVLYDIVAISYVREDENPLRYANEIHREKVDTFMLLSHKVDPFFFRLPEVKHWLTMFDLSAANWERYLADSATAHVERERWIKACSPHTESESNEEPSKVS